VEKLEILEGWMMTMIKKVAENLTEISEKLQEIYLLSQKNHGATYTTESLEYMMGNCHDAMKNMRIDAEELTNIYFSYTQDYLNLLKNTFSPENSQAMLPHDDRRFKEKLWNENPVFNFISQLYLLNNKHVEQTCQAVEGIDDHAKEKLLFHIRQLMDAIAPSNFFLTNPYVLQDALNTHGENLMKGLDNFIDDMKRNDGKLQITMTDFNAFTLGENIAATPGKVIFQNNLMQLIQYQPQTVKIYKKPLLIIPPWINKYYILDLSQENSLVYWLVNQGYTVFIISWVNPDLTHAHINFEDYMREGPLAALDAIQEATGEKSVNAVGYCIGGTLLASTLAYLAKKKENRIASGTYLATMLDFSKPGNLSVFLDEKQVNYLEQYVEKQGYLDGYTLSQAFNMLRSNDLIWSYFVKNYLQGGKPLPLDILYWNADSTNLPKTMLIFYLQNMYLNNRLMQRDEMQLLNTPIDLREIKNPVYFLSTQQDHIAPWESTYVGRSLHGGPTTFTLGGSGHIAGIINPPEKKKYFYYTNDATHENALNADHFMKNAVKNDGSWWNHWESWLRQQSGHQIEAHMIEEGQLPIIESAPGSYVKI
jgi:polyhydroxyalkanoate synthase subunit PhaC